jgi:predicted acyltransferase
MTTEPRSPVRPIRSSAVTDGRFISLDMFRGATIFLMILVNTAGPGARPYTQLTHAGWFGFTIADLVFPSFLFAVGNAMSFAFRRQLSPWAFVARVLRRGGLILLLGILMYWYPFVARLADGGWAPIPFSVTRLTGVLQRIALCYMLAAVAARWLSPPALVVLSASMLLGYWCILTTFSEPGMAFDRYANAGTQLDLWAIGRDHLYKKDHGFDPEGLLGTLPATVNVLCGFLAGRFVQPRGMTFTMVLQMTAAGAGLILLALLWASAFPIGKKLWTGSFVLLTIGIDLALLAGLIELVERRGLTVGREFLAMLGRNPMAIYLFSELLVISMQMIRVGPGMGLYDWLGHEVFQTVAAGPLGSVLCALFYTLICCLFGWWLDRRGWYLRV